MPYWIVKFKLQYSFAYTAILQWSNAIIMNNVILTKQFLIATFGMFVDGEKWDTSQRADIPKLVKQWQQICIQDS